ncbi:GIY-YIG nuclease family protein [Nostocaceae cyanobacterium CENA357]|uniref:GIY-YIG nuclease family protein n=1 Tax=Atlanticothrix silvestris CENA357 TaxID=1725252 RepID=A0A8J7HIH3_9CYAN|nr:GIY-YIG nuclease family protein [Atlanticothrix silvestris]MBH8553075.1 GIY-YIG nuclease family protein [Atlanticothrix silvestris CENA357]
MTTETNIPALATLEYVAYIDDSGQLPEKFQGKIGVYAIFDQKKVLQFVGYSRDVYLSLRQHLVRQPQKCYWVKVQTIERPSRTILANIENAWIAQNGNVPSGNGENQETWTQPIDIKKIMTPEEQANYQKPTNDELTQIKIIKNVARRVETEILASLEARGLQTQIRFNPKLKEEGLLDLK